MLAIFRQTFARIKRLIVRFSGFSCQHAMHVVIAQPLYSIAKESLFLSHFLTSCFERKYSSHIAQHVYRVARRLQVHFPMTPASVAKSQ